MLGTEFDNVLSECSHPILDTGYLFNHIIKIQVFGRNVVEIVNSSSDAIGHHVEVAVQQPTEVADRCNHAKLQRFFPEFFLVDWIGVHRVSPLTNRQAEVQSQPQSRANNAIPMSESSSMPA